MGKKKFVREDDEGSTDDEAGSSGPISNPGHSCPHVGKAVSMPNLKKNLKISWLRIGQCNPCDKERKSLAQKSRFQSQGDLKKTASPGKTPPTIAPTSKISVDPSLPVDIWMCLRCAAQTCSPKVSPPVPADVSHSMQHYKVPRSELHCIVLNVETWTLWCFECKMELYIDSFKKLHEAVDHVKRVTSTKGLSLATVKKEIHFPAAVAAAGSVKNQASIGGLIPKPRGLNNLGNTCFFNSVMQCLSASHPLVKQLDTHCQNGATLNLPEIKVRSKVSRWDSGIGASRSESTHSSNDDDESTTIEETQVEPLCLKLAESGAVTLAVAAFFKEMYSVGIKSGPINPGHLFGQICRRSPQFRGYQQQDAHELLRHLMDGLRTEEVRRQRVAVLKHFGLSEKSDPKKVDERTRRKVNALSRHSSYTIVDKIFGGHLVSTIVCEQCHNSSQIYEPFLDLSLPLVDQKPPRPCPGSNKSRRESSKTENDEFDISCFGKNKKKSDGDDADLNSKYQIKKNRAKAKKEKRKNRSRKHHTVAASAEEEDANGETEAHDKGREEQEQQEEKNCEEVDKPPESELAVNSERDVNVEEQENEIVDGKSDVVENSEDISKVAETSTKSSQSPPSKMSQSKMALSTPSKTLQSSAGKSKNAKSKRAGSDDDDEDDGYSEEDEGDDWEWDYGEQWGEEAEGQHDVKVVNNDRDHDEDSDYLEVDHEEDEVEPHMGHKAKQSLNPLPPERLERGSSEREKSSDGVLADDDPEDETDASMNGDVEDNVDDSRQHLTKSTHSVDEDQLTELYHPDSKHLDPHMESLCRRVRKLSVASSNFLQDETKSEDESRKKEEEKSQQETEDEESQLVKLQQQWISRSLTSIATRYNSRPGECSVYCSLSQFTAPELLTGSNRWACDRCTELAAKSNSSDFENEDSSDEKKNKTKKPTTVYSNASKQLLIFCPPAILTIHIKRFQQTMSGLRKDNRHVEFPLSLNLAPFCSYTSLSMPNVQAGTEEILYNVFGVVEHSGRLQGGHYTAFVKVRPASVASVEKFFSHPTFRTDDISFLMSEIARKCHEKKKIETASDEESSSSSSKWFHISDSSVAEVTEDRVLKSQAYLIFYERAC